MILTNEEIMRINQTAEFDSAIGYARKIEEAAIESYKAELLKEVGEPVCYLYKDHEGSYRQAHDLQFKDAHTPVFTSDQVAAAVLKATKPLEERICDLTACKWPDAYTVIPVKINGQLHATSQAIRDEINSLRAKLTTAQEEGATVTSERDNLWFKLETAKAELADLRDQLAAAQEEWNQCSGLLDDAHRSIEMLEDQLATAEQRVAEACAAYMLDKNYNSLDFDRKYSAKEFCAGQKSTVEFLANMIRNGEYRKYMKEV